MVLSGGGARGAAHVGILKVIDRENIPVDCIVGTSFGALVGGLYSIGYTGAEIEDILLAEDWNSILSDEPQRRLIPLIDRKDARYQGQIAFRNWKPELPAGLWGGQRLSEILDRLTSRLMLGAQYDFDKLAIRFRAVATNLIDGKGHVFKEGSLTEALRASMAVPFIFAPYEKDGMLLADGGLTHNLPTEIALAMGAETIIAVDATSPLLTKDNIRTFFDVVDQSISLQMERNVEESRKSAAIVLDPDLHEFTNRDYDKLKAIIQRGEQEADEHLEQLKALTSGIPFRPRARVSEIDAPFVEAISFEGLKELEPSRLRKHLRIREGAAADPEEIAEDVSRLYATRLFESVGYNLESVRENRYRLTFIVKEAPLRTLGASLRYDNDYGFVALAEFNSRHMFNTPSSIIVSTQFGGLEDHSAAFHFAPISSGFFLEPKVHVFRRERFDIRDQTLVDKFTDKREGGQLMMGGFILRQLEIRGGYHYQRVRIMGGSAPNRLPDSTVTAGLALHINGDTLDSPEFPRGGMTLKIMIDKQAKSVGSDFEYSRWQADCQRYFSFSPKSTIKIHAGASYSHGDVPFFDLFYIGGRSFSGGASRPFMGLEHDEFAVRHAALMGASYRRQIFSNPLSFIKRGFLEGTYNGLFFSHRQSSPYEVRYFNGGGLGLALDTMLGPLRFAGGWGEGGRLNLYFSFGPDF